jgi:hypothetical protein
MAPQLEKEQAMSWNAFHYSLEPGHTGSYWFGWGDDHGAQIAEAREFPQSTRGNSLFTTDISTVRNNDNSITYWVNVKNNGGHTATFELVGGGLT